MSNPPIEANSGATGVVLPTFSNSATGRASEVPEARPTLGSQAPQASSPIRSAGFGISLFLNQDTGTGGDSQRTRPETDEENKGVQQSGQPQMQVILPTQHISDHLEDTQKGLLNSGTPPTGFGPTLGNLLVAFHHGPSMVQGHSQMHHHHHHHHPQQHLVQTTDQSQDLARSDANSVPATILEQRQSHAEDHKGYIDIDKLGIVKVIEDFFPHRRNIGSVVYNPTTTWLTLQTEALVGLKPEHQERFLDIKINFSEQVRHDKRQIKYIPVIPPLPFEYINNTIEVKIPYRYIKIFKELLDHNHEDFKRELWGGAGGVYTDDSDILSILVHKGLFTNTMDLSDWNQTWNAQKDFIRPQLISHTANETADEQDDGIYGDLSVEILLLPTLPHYHGFFANGINSRSWTGHDRHDGLSLAVCNIKWESFGSYMRDKSLFKISELELYNDMEILREQHQHNSWRFDTQRFSEIKKKYGSKTSS